MARFTYVHAKKNWGQLMRMFRMLSVSVVLVAVTSCGVPDDGIEWEKQSQGIKDPKWVYCENPGNKYTRCYEVISKRRPRDFPNQYRNAALIGSVETWEENRETFEREIRYIEITGFLVEYGGDAFVDVFRLSDGRGERKVLRVLNDRCSKELDLPIFFDPTREDHLFWDGFTKFGLVPEGRCLGAETGKVCLSPEAEVSDVHGNPCYLRLEMVPTAD